ncbi:MAG TPA: RDD family protein [Caulobacteraceae bacterium]|jgi:uncharacterized RDD family membrane protein YckC|nr:RDD family protein [Caulobacteraceae bacterium]
MIEDVFGEGDPPSAERLGHDAWARFLARILDVQLSLFVAAFVIIGAAGLLARSGAPQLTDVLLHKPGWAAAIGIPTTFLIGGALEAFCLSAFGATPGKALMGVRVREADRSKLTFLRAFRRWFSVLMTGRGLDFPVISFILNFVAYRRFLRDGVTVWDDEMDVYVERHQVSDWRWLILLALVAAVFVSSPKALHLLNTMLLGILSTSPMPFKL